MCSLRRFALLALPIIGTVFAEVQPSPTLPSIADLKQDFQDLIDALPEESVQAALQGHLPAFQNGIFESGHHGLNAVHRRDPRLATKLIVAAVQELTKRQNTDNSTVTGNSASPTPSASSTPLPSSTPTSAASPSSASSPAPSSASASPSASAPSPSRSASPSASASASAPVSNTPSPSAPTPTPTPSVTVISVTTTNSAGSKIVTSAPANIVTTTDSEGSTFTSASPIKPTPTTPKEVTTTNAKGSTFVTTVTPGGGKVSSIVLITEVGPDNKPVTKTSYTFVDPVEQTGTSGPQETASVTPRLQTGAAVQGQVVAAGLWGVVGGIAAMLL